MVNYTSDEDSANETVAEIRNVGSDAIAVRADVSKPTEIARLLKEWASLAL